MIPKIIHYCWFGGKPKPQIVEDYIQSWKKYLPDYKIIEWNEDNFDVTKHLYTKQANESGKFAFVSDYCRLYVLKEFGGIYLDTDVQMLKSLDPLLNHQVFMGFEDDRWVGASVIGAEKNALFIDELLSLYNDRKFILENKKFDITPNVVIITDYLKSKNVVTDEGINHYENKLIIYTKDYFSPKVFDTKKIELTENTYSIHHFSQTWTSAKHQFIQKGKFVLIKILGVKKTRKIIDRINNKK
jgi:mannosyltransferase OCH1-like enzyme